MLKDVSVLTAFRWEKMKLEFDHSYNLPKFCTLFYRKVLWKLGVLFSLKWKWKGAFGK